MIGVAIFLALFIFSILDVSFLARLTILGTSPMISVTAVLMLATFSKSKRNFLWIIIPACVISIFSEHSCAIIFIAFAIAYFLMRQRKTYFWDNQLVCRAFNVCLSVSVFYLILFMYSIIFAEETFFASVVYSLGVFMAIEVLLFFIGNWIYYNGKIRRIW